MRLVAPLAAALLAISCSTPMPSASPSAAPSSPTVGPSETPSPNTTAAPSATVGPILDVPLSANAAEALQAVIDGYLVEHGLAPSISAAVIVPGVGIWSGSGSFADREAEVRATPDTVYAIGGITQTFVAALILRLAEDGYLALDDPAAEYLGPTAAAQTNDATVRQLLGHRSGIDDYYPVVRPDQAWTIEELLGLIGAPHFSPGTDTEYSNTNYLLLGLIAEVVTGGPLGELLHEYLLDRFDLTRTYYAASETVDEPFARGYVVADGVYRDVYDGSGHLPNTNSASATRGAGAMASTASDLARWIYLLCSGQVLRPESQSAMFDVSRSTEYGLGVVQLSDRSAGQVVGHSGSADGFMGAGYYALRSGMVVVFLTNGWDLDPPETLNRFFEAGLPAMD